MRKSEEGVTVTFTGCSSYMHGFWNHYAGFRASDEGCVPTIQRPEPKGRVRERVVLK